MGELNWFGLIAMPSRPHRYKYIDDALRSRIIYYNFNERLSCADTNECYGYPYETIKSIAKVFFNQMVN